MINFHGVHKSELFKRVLLKNHNITNNYHTNVIEVSFCSKNNLIIGILLFEFHQKRKQTFLFSPCY